MGNNEINQILINVHKRTLQARAFERLVESHEFAEIFKITGHTDALKVILISGDPTDLKDWIKDNTPKELGSMSYRELRDLAKARHIPRWSRLDTFELMEALSGLEL